MKPLNLLVVDDEPLARRRVVRLLRQLPWAGQIEEAAHVQQALACLDRFEAHILLLDIQMPGGSGFDLLAQWAQSARSSGRPGPPPAVVFVTAFDDQACRAFDASATDFIHVESTVSLAIEGIQRLAVAAELEIKGPLFQM